MIVRYINVHLLLLIYYYQDLLLLLLLARHPDIMGLGKTSSLSPLYEPLPEVSVIVAYVSVVVYVTC